MSAAPNDKHNPERRLSGKRARLLIVAALVVIAVVVVGYLLLVGGTVGD
jgi:hypothetical protein